MEDRIKQYMGEYLLDREQRMNADFSNAVLSMCAWAFLCGAVVALSNLLPMVIGFALGIAVATRSPDLVNFFVQRFVAIISRVRERPEKPDIVKN